MRSKPSFMEDTTLKSASILKKKLKSSSEKKLRIYTSGSFDLFHFGHSNFFKQIKTAYPNSELMIGIYSDYEIRKEKCLNVKLY